MILVNLPSIICSGIDDQWRVMAKSINPGNSISDLLFNPAFCVLGIPTPGAAYLRTTTRYILRWTWYCNGALWRVSMPLSLKSSMESPGHHQVWSQNISFLFYSSTLSLSKSPFSGRGKTMDCPDLNTISFKQMDSPSWSCASICDDQAGQNPFQCFGEAILGVNQGQSFIEPTFKVRKIWLSNWKLNPDYITPVLEDIH